MFYVGFFGAIMNKAQSLVVFLIATKEIIKEQI
jgi:hypothetical protein